MEKKKEYCSPEEFIALCREYDVYITAEMLAEFEKKEIFKPVKPKKYHEMQVITAFLIVEGLQDGMSEKNLKGYYDDFMCYYGETVDIHDEEKKALFIMGYSIINQKIADKQKALANLSNLAGRFYLDKIGK